MNDEPNNDAATQFKDEILGVIYRYSQESDLAVYELLGALEVCKAAILKLHQESKG